MKQLDARRLLCPMPVIKVQDAIKTMQPDEQLQVTCTDPGALNDVPAWCRINGHQVLSTKEVADEVILIIKVGKS